MGDVSDHPPVLLIVAAFSRYPDALDWGRRRCTEVFGPLALESAAFAFEETDYYEPTMGSGLLKTFWAFEKPVDPARLPQIKLDANDWETEYARQSEHPEPRPLNLDPGYLTLGKLVLASTKDHAHRIYLQRGIFAEVTLFYQNHAWRHHDKTFRDYRREDYQQFFTRCREYFKQASRS